jgi:hypothetical protein
VEYQPSHEKQCKACFERSGEGFNGDERGIVSTKVQNEFMLVEGYLDDAGLPKFTVYIAKWPVTFSLTLKQAKQLIDALTYVSTRFD